MNKDSLDSSTQKPRLSINHIDEVLKPLSNPTRQHLLILLAEGPITYTELLERLKIESGSFYWHVGKMKSLISQDELKAYELSPLGRKAYDLLVFDGNGVSSPPFRPNWYQIILKYTGKIYQLPSWILIQQIGLLLIFSVLLFHNQEFLQFGTLVLPKSSSLVWTMISLLLSIFVLSISVSIMQYLYVRPDQQYLIKPLLPQVIRLCLGSCFILVSGLLFVGISQFLPREISTSPVVQLIIAFIGLFMTVLVTTTFVDLFLDTGIKDALLVVLPPYYILVLVSFFLSQLVT